MIDEVGGRKFILTILSLVGCFVLVAIGKMAVDRFEVLLPVILGIYSSANVATKLTDTLNTKKPE